MERNPELVREQLRTRVAQGYDPTRDPESCEHHWVDWFVLSEKEFSETKAEAIRERKKGEPAR